MSDSSLVGCKPKRSRPLECFVFHHMVDPGEREGKEKGRGTVNGRALQKLCAVKWQEPWIRPR